MAALYVQGCWAPRLYCISHIGANANQCRVTSQPHSYWRILIDHYSLKYSTPLISETLYRPGHSIYLFPRFSFYCPPFLPLSVQLKVYQFCLTLQRTKFWLQFVYFLFDLCLLCFLVFILGLSYSFSSFLVQKPRPFIFFNYNEICVKNLPP